jgi:hypothetical protein
MLELGEAAHLYQIEKAYTEPLLKRMVAAIKPGETERIWGPKTFRKN